MILDKLRDGPAAAHQVDDVQVVVVALGTAFLGIDILPQSSAEQTSLQVVGGQGIAGTQYDEIFHNRFHPFQKKKHSVEVYTEMAKSAR